MTSARVVKDFYQWFSKALSNKNFFLFSEVQFRLNSTKLSPTEVPSSVCSLPCPEGQMKKYDEGESCCWTCHECIAYQVSFKAIHFCNIYFSFNNFPNDSFLNYSYKISINFLDTWSQRWDKMSRMSEWNSPRRK